jgi:ankyrin repeat protein
MRIVVAVFALLLGLTAHAATPDQLRTAATRALASIQSGSTGFYKITHSSSCHDHSLPMLTYQLARDRGLPLDEAAINTVAAKGFLASPDLNSIDAAVQDYEIIDPAPSEGWALMAAHAAGVAPNFVAATYVRRVATWQRPDGHFPTFDVRPPQSYSRFTATAVAVRSLQLYMPPQLIKESEERIRRAREWFLTAKPHETEDFTFRLFGLLWSGAAFQDRRRAARELLLLQRPDGGWGQLPHMGTDAYATGSALVALHEAGGIPVTDPAWQKGLKFLLTTQASDGTWHVRTRMVSPAAVSPPYFETGFPYGRDQFISKSGTCWAAMALMLALPKAARSAAPPPLPALVPKGLEPWMETALFGAPAQLKAAFDQGLDPNSKTADGTTLLMMAMPDAAKVKLVIERGADVRAKAATGYTALEVAASFNGAADSLKLLLERSASVDPEKGIKYDASALFLAAMAGDLESVRLLVAKGGNPNRPMTLLGTFPTTPLMVAAIFNYGDVAQALLAAGADVHWKDQDGMTPLHWATLAHHSEMVKLLAAQGADLNAADRYGYTPLHYAAQVDFGDAETVKALLAAGADPNLKEKEGKTALHLAASTPLIRAALEAAAKP